MKMVQLFNVAEDLCYVVFREGLVMPPLLFGLVENSLKKNKHTPNDTAWGYT